MTIEPAGAVLHSVGFQHTPSVADVEARKTAVEFEAVFLGTFVEAMLPESESLYGGGMAGGMWKSQLASGIAMQLAQSNLLGIGEMVVQDAQDRAISGR